MIYDHGSMCKCIGYIYSLSYLDYREIEKKDILFKGEIILPEEKEKINKILSDYNLSSKIDQLSKKKEII